MSNATSPLVFIVEDDRDIAALIDHTMRRSGFATQVFFDGETVTRSAQAQLPALILLDIMLPGRDGMEILQELESGSRTRPIRKIILSARGSESEKVRALEMGADDYLTKPFSPRELVLRVKAVLRSLPGNSENTRILQIGDIIADLDARIVTVQNRQVEFSTTEYNVLIYLMLHPGRTITRGRILDSVWAQKSVDGSRIVDVYIRRIRERIETDPSRPERLVTRRGGGYTLVDIEDSRTSGTSSA